MSPMSTLGRQSELGKSMIAVALVTDAYHEDRRGERRYSTVEGMHARAHARS